MCGICGYALREHSPSPAFLEAMCRPLKRRGPDALGVYSAPGIGLGHTRLSVIDLETGHQPMHSADKRYSIVFNGEIYNYRQLRRELEEYGCAFRTQSDTEALLYACIHWGEKALTRCNGMFAFALWDDKEKSLLLARDRLGVKPLYWARCPLGGLLFASELSAITASEMIPRIRSASALQSCLALGYVLGEQSIIQGVYRLQPGHCLRFKDGDIRMAHWWDLAEVWKRGPGHALSDTDYAEQFQSLLDDCVKIRLKSDVPLGAFLSGGVDSSAVTAAMRRAREEVFTFTMTFDDSRFDEGPQAARVAAHLGVRHQQAKADADALDVLLDLAAHLDEPFADTSVIPTQMLCGMARRHITVALSGDGGDELLAGYITLRADALFPCLKRIPPLLAALLSYLADSLPDLRGKVTFTYKLKQFLAAYPLSPQDAHAWWRMLFSGEQLARMLPGSDVDALLAPFRQAWDASEGMNAQDRFLFMDYKTWLADDILFKADRASMRHGLEVRSPFLDYRLVEYCATLPSHLKRQGGTGKVLLREVAGRRVPRSILDAPKRGFNAPVSHWLAHEWRDVAEDVFRPATLLGCGLDPALPRRCWEEHLAGGRDHGFRLFSVLMYVLWAQRHLRG